MTVIDILIIGSGGFLGAVIRYFISGKFNKVGRALPFGTLSVNIAGSLLIGFVAGLGVTKPWTLFLVSGFGGALTTFSTLTKELLQFWIGKRKKHFFIYLFLTYGIGIIMAFVGFLVGNAW